MTRPTLQEYATSTVDELAVHPASAQPVEIVDVGFCKVDPAVDVLWK